MSDLEEKTVDILDKLEKLITQYTPKVINAAESAVQVSAVGEILYGVIGLLCGAVLWFLYKNYKKYTLQDNPEAVWAGEVNLKNSFVVGVSGVVATVVLLTSIWNLGNIWIWTAIVDPRLALAHQILGL